jgi:glycogen synthase
MRVALIPSAYAPAIGGVEELTARLAAQLRGAGDEVEVWTHRHPADLPAEQELNGVAVRRFAFPLPSASGLASFPHRARAASDALRKAAEAFRPDVLHVQAFSSNGVYASRLARRLRLPLVVTLQGETVMDDHDVYRHSTVLRLTLRQALRRADAVTACSRFVLADAEERFGLAPGRGIVIPNGVELDEDVEPEPLELPFTRFVLGFGRLVEKKGFDLLVTAFERIADAHPDVGLVIGGDGPVRATLAGERVVLPGALSRGQVAWALDAASVFVLPSRVEPFGIVVLEALRAGRPVVVSTRGGATEIARDGLDGIAVDPEDVPALAAAIDRVLREPELFGATGRERAASFAWPIVAARYRELYEQVTA